jgi:hypothetical protein
MAGDGHHTLSVNCLVFTGGCGGERYEGTEGGVNLGGSKAKVR